MIACCNYCYEKFITEDGSLDYDRLAKAIDLYEMEQANLDHVEVDVNELKEAHARGVIRICTCDCHKDGMNLLH